MKYFNNCATIDEVKVLYRDLAKTHHPDKGGDLKIMQEINSEYAFASAKILKGENLTDSEIEEELLKIEEYKAAIDKVINLEGIQIEIVGNWLWITGDTKPHREILGDKEGKYPPKFYFAYKKCAWYFHTSEFKSRGRGKNTLDDIRQKYGSKVITGKYGRKLNG